MPHLSVPSPRRTASRPSLATTSPTTYIHIYVCVCVCVYIYMYIYIASRVLALS